MPRILLKERCAFGNVDTGGAWLSSARAVRCWVKSRNESLIKAMKDQLKYVFSYGNYIKDLNKGLTHLEVAIKRVQDDVNAATYNGQKIHDDVTKWLDDAKKIIEQAAEVLENDKNSKKGCFRGVIPNPSTRFRIARQAEGNKQEIDMLQQRNHFPTVSHQQVPPGIVIGEYKGPEYWIAPSRELLLQDVSKDLLDAKVRVVGIFGASGVGKSIFLKQLEKQVQERKHHYDFDAVTIVTVSRSPNWEKVQDDLGYRLGLEMQKENSVEKKGGRLWDRLLSEKGKILIILDDIWEEIDLGKLGIPFGDNYPNIKLLLTSRSEEVLKSKMDSQCNFQLNPLKKSEAVDLFKQIVGEQVMDESTSIEQLVEECAGLPVLVSPLAASLKSRPSSTWAEALTKLKQSRSLGIEKFIDKSLEFNYHLIESEEGKSLFLLCGRIGNQIISIDHLVSFAMGLGLLKGVQRMEEARERVKELVDNLKASCLLEDHDEGYLKLHDLMADAALSIASNVHTSLVIRDSERLKAFYDDDFKGCKSISLHLDEEVHELPQRLACPELDMLLIGAEKSSNLEIPDNFFEHSRELKVLHISKLRITSLPSSIQFLKKLHTLCLDGVEIEDVAIIGKLKALKSLSLGGYKISRIPKEIGELNNLRVLNLAKCYGLRVIEPDVLGRLNHLEELTLPLNFDSWDAEGISNASLTELNNTLHLRTLVIRVPNAASLATVIPFQKLEWYDIYIGKLWFGNDIGVRRSLKLEFDSRKSKLIWKEWLQTVLKKTQDLCLSGWIGTQDTVTKLSKKGFLELKRIRVQNCPSIQYIIHSKQSDPLPVLESLSLHGLINLRMICNGDLPLMSLRNLTVIKIEACNELKNLFSFSLVKLLPSLQESKVVDCPMIREIITFAEVESIDSGERDRDKKEMIELRSMRNLELVNLQNFSSFCSKGSKEVVEDDGKSQFEFLDGRQVSLPCLESLILRGLPKLRKISPTPHPVNLCSLKSLELVECKSLSYAIESNLLQQLKNLESLVIKDCESMETVFHLEELDTREAVSNQSLQVNLKLSNLPRLKKIWNKDPQEIASFLELKKLEVFGCDELENIFPTSKGKAFGNIIHISIASCMAMKEIISEEENDDQEIEFPSLSYLSISKMENLTMFSHGNRRCRFPCLMELIISDCPKMRAFVSAKHGKEELLSELAKGDETFFDEKVVLPRLEKLVVHSLGSMMSIWDDNNLLEDSFHKLTSIEIGKCARVKSIFDSHMVERLQNLTKVKVESCESLEVLFEHGHRKLESHSVKEVALGFPSLRDIFVKDCCRLVNLFPNAMARTLSELEIMYISSCQHLVEVISYDGEGYMALTEEMEFYNLSSLHLEDLRSLIHFCTGHYELCFPFLKKLSIIKCIRLKEFVLRSSNLVEPEEQFHEISSTSNINVGFSPLFDEKVVFPNLEELRIEGLKVKEIWPKKEPTSFLMELKQLEVEDCDQLSTIVPSFILHNLHSLENLSVRSCKSMEVVFELERNSSRRQKISRGKSTRKILGHLHKLTVDSCESMQHIIVTGDDDYVEETCCKTVIFPQLYSLKLSKLPRLGAFCSKNDDINLPSLVKMRIRDCRSIKVLVADSNQDYEPLLLVEKVEFPRMASMFISNMRELRELWHISKESNHSECSSSSEAFCKLKMLTVEKCDNLLTVFPSKMIRAFHNLKELRIEDCESLESVFESPSLWSGTNNFNEVVPKQVWDDVEDPRWAYLSFEKLYAIYISTCNSLRHLFPASVANRLIKLNRLVIEDCEGMEGIVWNEESAHHHQFSSTPSTESTNSSTLAGVHSLEWPSLIELNLRKCPKAKIFAPVQQKLNIPKLEKITPENRQLIDEMCATGDITTLVLKSIENQEWVESTSWSLLVERFPNLHSLVIRWSDSKEIFPSDNEKERGKSGILDIVKTLGIYYCRQLTILPPYLALFHNLTELTVIGCNGLRYLVTSSVARGLVQLTHLEIQFCNNLEEIVTYDFDENNGNRAKDDDADIISFPHLKRLKLWFLPKLRSFSSTSCKFDFPSLVEAEMVEVTAMHVFCEGDFTTPHKHSITRGIRAMCNKETYRFRIPLGS